MIIKSILKTAYELSKIDLNNINNIIIEQKK